MRKQNIILTIWLALPITIVSLLMVWIFVSLDKDRLMDDAVPYGAGAGDTGNANAIGEWLAGHNADAISLAVKARREGLAIDPRDWPGGVEIHVLSQSVVVGQHPEFAAYRQSGIMDASPAIAIGNGYASQVFKGEEDDPYIVMYFSPDGLRTETDPMNNAYPIPMMVESQGGIRLRPISLEPQIPNPNLQTSDPMVIEVRMDSVYEESP